MSAEELEQGSGAVICVPTYNERATLRAFTEAVLAAAPSAHVLLIDDNSPDGTGQIADDLAREQPRVEVLHRRSRDGVGPAYLEGFRRAHERGFDFIVQMAADFSHDPKYLRPLLRALDQADVVVGSRRVPGGGFVGRGFLRRAASHGGNLCARGILGIETRDLTGGFNGYRRAVLETIGLEGLATTGYGFQIELGYRCLRAGYEVVEIPMVFADSQKSVSEMSPAVFVEAMISVLNLRLGRK